MATMYVAVISDYDYAAFRGLEGQNFPETFHLWSYEQEKRSQNFIASGHEVVPVRINSSEFAAYCRARNIGHNAHNLDHFTFEKATGKLDQS